MDPTRNVTSLRQLSDLAGCLPAVSSTTSIRVYYDSSDTLLKNAEKAHTAQNYEEEYLWLMRFAILIYERLQSHDQYNKTAEAQRLNKVYRGKCKHVLNRLEVLKEELAIHFQEKAILAAAEAESSAKTSNPKSKIATAIDEISLNDSTTSSASSDPKYSSTTSNIPTEKDLLARLARLNNLKPAEAKEPSVKEQTEPVTASSSETSTTDHVTSSELQEEPKESFSTLTLGNLDFSVFESSTPTTTSSSSKDPLDELKLIPDVEIKDPTMDLSWLEDDPIFGSKNRSPAPSGPSPTTSRESRSSQASNANGSSKSISSESPNDLPDWITSTISKHNLKPEQPPSYSAAQVRSSDPKSPSAITPTAKYQVITVSSDEPAAKQSNLKPTTSPVPVVEAAATDEYSFTKTLRGQQFDPEVMNKRLLDTTVGATCSEFLPIPSGPYAMQAESSKPTSPFSLPAGMGMITPSTSQKSPSSSSQSQRSSPSFSASGSKPLPPSYASHQHKHGSEGHRSQKAVTAVSEYGSPSGSASPSSAPTSISGSHYIYQPSPNLQAKLPLLGNVPVVFRPNQLNMFDPSKAVIPATTQYGVANMASPSGSSLAAGMGAVSPSLGSPSISAAKSSSSPTSSSSSSPSSSRPPKYSKPNTSVGSTSNKAKSSSSATPRSSVPSSSPAASASSAFPLMTNQRPGAAVEDLSLRKVEMDGDMFDKFMSAAHRNTIRSIETCGILAGKFLPNKRKFRVTHLIIPKQTGTTDTCATTNEDEIFEFQIKHDLLTLGWVHTHPTQACFLSSVDLHTHCSYQSLFPEAIAVVIAPRDNPNFSFFHLSKSGFNTVQNCPLKGFHHHPERGLYEACSHVVLSWNSKKPCKVVDMR